METCGWVFKFLQLQPGSKILTSQLLTEGFASFYQYEAPEQSHRSKPKHLICVTRVAPSGRHVTDSVFLQSQCELWGFYYLVSGLQHPVLPFPKWACSLPLASSDSVFFS